MADNALTRGLYQAKIGPTPRNALLGGIADALRYVDEGANVPDPTNPAQKGRKVLSFISNALGIGDLAAVADRASYGLPQTQGTGFARQMLPETRNALAGAFPAAIAKPQTAARMAMSVLTNGLDAGSMNKAALVWHGSPHKFDKFDSSKIGTGEGAQAYGHGLYLAENPGVAGEYSKLSPTVTPSPVRAFRGAELTAGTPEYHAATLVESMGLQQARKQVASWIANADPRMVREAEGWKQTLATLNAAASKSDFKKLPNTGNLYKVDLPDPMIARMLDWDKPLSQQAPEVQAWAQRDDIRALHQMTNKGLSQATGADLYRNITATLNQKKTGDLPSQMFQNNRLAGSVDAADALRQVGIPGIRYLDGGSRGAGAGTSNFVVFPGEENALTILQRNGQPIR